MRSLILRINQFLGWFKTANRIRGIVIHQSHLIFEITSTTEDQLLPERFFNGSIQS